MTAAALAAAAGAAPSQSPPSAPLPVKAHVTQEDKIWAKDKESGQIVQMQQANAMFGLSGGYPLPAVTVGAGAAVHLKQP